MFSKQIVHTDAFMDMPATAQNLYFHLSMEADDDGFVSNPNRILKLLGSNADDYKILVAKRFILQFKSGICVIKHWMIHNYIQNDRYTPTTHLLEKSLLEIKDNRAYTEKDKKIYIENRKEAMGESNLPYSFAYKMRNAFWGRKCPLCNFDMRETGTSITRKPTIQHCLPISKGGKHEIENIAIICHNCNVSLRDKETEKLNNNEVKEVWDNLVSNSDTENVSSLDTQVRIGKDRIELGKVREEKEIYGEFKNVKLLKEEYEKLVKTFTEKNTIILIEELSGYIA